MFKSLSTKEIYDNSSLSFVFEFFTPLNKREAAAKFARGLGKKVKWFTQINSDFEPTHESFKIAPIYSKEYKEISLSTGFMNYHEAIHMFLKAMNIIESIGTTTDRCSVTTRIRLDSETLGLPAEMHSLNKFKYLLGIKEEELFKMWPAKDNETGKIYQNHFQYIQPKDIYNTIVSERFIEKMNPVEFNFPESDFFANNFSELSREQLVVKYISGKEYTRKKKESVDTINLVIEHLYDTLLHNYEYTIDERRKITGIVNEFKNSINGTRSYLNFKMIYPNIDLYVDLKSDPYLIEANYQTIRDKIFKVIVGGGIKEGVINYDTRRKSVQIKDVVLKKSILIEGIEFYQCEIEADAKNCLFEGCTIRNSKLVECSVFSNNTIKNSKILDCDYLGQSNKIVRSYLDNSDKKMINADLSECLVNHGHFTLNSTLDKKTKLINRK